MLAGKTGDHAGQYPLSVNGVVRPVIRKRTGYESGESEVQEQLDNLVKRHYLRTVSGFGNQVTKYEQRFCNSEFGDLKRAPQKWR
ncbi:MAG: DUF480 domain-containing protein [Escherichia coli]